MAKFERFEDIDAWGKARELTQMANDTSKMISGLISYLSQHF